MTLIPRLGVAADSPSAKPSGNLSACQKEAASKLTNKKEHELKACEEALAVAKKKSATSQQLAAKVQTLAKEVEQLRSEKAMVALQLKNGAQPVSANAKKQRKETKQNKTKAAKASGSLTVKHQETLEELDKCLDKASEKAKALAGAIKEAQRSRAVAEDRFKKTDKTLAGVREQMTKVETELANMKKRDRSNRDQLAKLEEQLGSSRKRAEAENTRLKETAKQLTLWENRAKKAEHNLTQTKEAMATSLKVAAQAKTLGSQFQEKLTIASAQLVERDQALGAHTKSLNEAKAEVKRCKTRLSEVETELVTYRTRSGNADKALASSKKSLEKLRQSKLATEKELMRLKGQLADSNNKNKRIPKLEGELKTVTTALATASKQQEKLGSDAENVRKQLDTALMDREDLHDRLTILRNEFATYRTTTGREQKRLSLEATNLLQSSLVKKDREWESQLTKRSDELKRLQASLKAKEKALQDAYSREKSALTKLSDTEKARSREAASRKALDQALASLKVKLDASQKQACKLKEQLTEIEKLTTPGS